MYSKDKIIILIVIIAGILSLAVIIGFIGQGNIRHVEIFYPEKVEQTIAFRDVNGETKIVGLKGIGEDDNPTLIMRTSFAYVLTVVNQGDKHHRLYIDGLNIQTDLLEPGQNETITIFPSEEGIYNYYDKRERLKLLGEIKAVQVVPSDGFQGTLKDLI